MSNVFFVIPFAGRRDAQSWDTARALLAATLRSIFSQTDPNFGVFIAGHEAPAIPELEDPRVRFLSAGFDKPAHPSEAMRDKYRKKRMVLQAVAKAGGGDAIFMDADDLVSSRLVAFVREANHPNGLLFTHGYIWDAAAARLAPIPGAYKTPFYKHCGSCMVLRVGPGDAPAGGAYKGSRAEAYKRHAEYGEIAAAQGRPLAEISLPAMVYVVNTGAGDSETRNPKTEERLARISSSAIEITPTIKQTFTLAPTRPRAKGSAQRFIDAQGEMLAAALANGEERERRVAITRIIEKCFIDYAVEVAPPLILEIGAHEATFSAAMQKRLPNAHCIAVEANPMVFEAHHSNLIARGVDYRHACVSDATEAACLKVPIKDGKPRLKMGSINADTQAREFLEFLVNTVALDAIAPIQRNVMWVDVEGGVAQVLASGPRMLAQCDALYIEVEKQRRWADQAIDAEIVSTLSKYDLRPVLRDAARDRWQYNALFVRER